MWEFKEEYKMQQPTPEQIFGTYVPWEAKKGTWFINFMIGSQNIYLLEGKEKAMLIDTGWGAAPPDPRTATGHNCNFIQMLIHNISSFLPYHPFFNI